jgi:hypothetical protein
MGPCSTNRICGTRRNVIVGVSFLSLVTYSLVSNSYFSTLAYHPDFSSQQNQMGEMIMAAVTKQPTDPATLSNQSQISNGYTATTTTTEADEPIMPRLAATTTTTEAKPIVPRLVSDNVGVESGEIPNSNNTFRAPHITSSFFVALEPIDICFVSSIFAPTTEIADRPHDWTNFQLGNATSFQFFMYTNLEDLKSPGWTKVLRNFTYRRFITQSRWGKFMAWKDPEIKACQTIFYFDGHYSPAGKSKIFAQLAKQIRESEFGLAQKLHPTKGRSVLGEFDKILKDKKDIERNVNASIKWLKAQPDFYNKCTMYENSFFGKSITCVLLFIRC